MRHLLTLVGAAVVTFAVVGWFLGWYQVKTTPGTNGHPQVNIDFNAPKIKQDLSKGKTKLLNILETNGQNGQGAPPAAPNGVAPTSNPPLPVPNLAPVASQNGTPPDGTVIVRPAAPTNVSRDGGDTWFVPPQ